MRASLHARVVLAASVVLAAFLGLTGLVLDRAFRDSVDTALRDRLQGHIYGLLAAADLDAEQVLRMPASLPEPRYALPGSGLYGRIDRSDGATLWSSASSLGIALPFTARPAPGSGAYEYLEIPGVGRLLGLSFAVSWELPDGSVRGYIFRVAETLAASRAQVTRFRASLWYWLGGAALLLLAVQGSILRWGLAPLRRVVGELGAIQRGERRRLGGDYPRELHGLTENLNALLASAEGHLQRYRDTLGNLAHSLKTPLAVLRGELERAPDVADPALTREQIARMSRIIDHQLQRAATAGRRTLVAPLAVQPVVDKLVGVLHKVHGDKTVRVVRDIDARVQFMGDEDDLMELLGNLLENAFKWCRSQVRVRTRAPADRRYRLELCIEDDGPGIAPEWVAKVLERGGRADSGVDGHGIGLTMVRDIIVLYGGELDVDRSTLGGARVCLRLP